MRRVLRNKYLLPQATKRSLLRVGLVTLAAYVVFGHVLIPLRIAGQSMAPTYRDGGFNFCNRLSYRFGEPQRADVVAVRFAGERVMLLKRIVALPGQTVAFRDGELIIDGRQAREPYVRQKADWNLPERTVAPGMVYVVGDNRGGPMAQHTFGQVAIERIVGKVLW